MSAPNKITDLLASPRGGNTGTPSNSRYQSAYENVDEFWRFNHTTQMYTYREQPIYIRVKPGLQFKIPRKILSPRHNPNLSSGVSSPIVQLGTHYYLRRGQTPEALIGLQAKSGDERGAQRNLEAYEEWKQQ